MTMSIGDGGTDARRLMERETYVGGVTSGRVTVEYPDGLEETARKLAREFDLFYATVEKELGIEWSFDLVLKLVRVEPSASGYRYSVILPKDRRLVFPVPVSRVGRGDSWTPVIVHEVTEASMLAPKTRVVLGDLYRGSFCVPLGTRWFRDGASAYAQHLFEIARCAAEGTDYELPGHIYGDLNRVRERLLAWTNCDGQPDWYGAALGLAAEMRNRFGDDAVVRFVSELSRTSVPDGRGLKRAFKRTTGTELADFLKAYETPWAGFAARNTAPSPVAPRAVLPGNRVEVTTVYPATPAWRRGIEPGDVIVSLDGEPVVSADRLAHLLARKRPWQVVSIEVERRGERIPMKLKLIPMPAHDPAIAGGN
jgi:hypothetical protein